MSVCEQNEILRRLPSESVRVCGRLTCTQVPRVAAIAATEGARRRVRIQSMISAAHALLGAAAAAADTSGIPGPDHLPALRKYLGYATQGMAVVGAPETLLERLEICLHDAIESASVQLEPRPVALSQYGGGGGGGGGMHSDPGVARAPASPAEGPRSAPPATPHLVSERAEVTRALWQE